MLMSSCVDSLGSSLWLDPMVRRSHLKEINVTINEASVRTELLQAHLAADNPQVTADVYLTFSFMHILITLIFNHLFYVFYLLNLEF